MARIQFEFHGRSGAPVDNDVATALAAQIEALRDACVAAGVDVSGHGVDVTLDPPTSEVELVPDVTLDPSADVEPAL